MFFPLSANYLHHFFLFFVNKRPFIHSIHGSQRIPGCDLQKHDRGPEYFYSPIRNFSPEAPEQAYRGSGVMLRGFWSITPRLL